MMGIGFCSSKLTLLYVVNYCTHSTIVHVIIAFLHGFLLKFEKRYNRQQFDVDFDCTV